MKNIRYKTIGYTKIWNPETKEVEKQKCYIKRKIPYSEANEEIAKREAWGGEYTVEDDGQPEPVAEPTTDEILNAMLGVM